jgi:sulfite reductase (ferredoxin)
MGARSRVGTLLEEFVPAGQIVAIAEAIKRVFDKHGNRKNRHHARLRFLLEDIGLEKLRELYRQELAAVPVSPAITRPVPAPAEKYSNQSYTSLFNSNNTKKKKNSQYQNL